MTTHSFRSLFSTVVNESNLFNLDPINASLLMCIKIEITRYKPSEILGSADEIDGVVWGGSKGLAELND